MFRYRVKNIFGFSTGYSPVATIKSAKRPEKPASITTSISGQNVKIDWVTPFDNYDSITRFEIEI
jgi:autonomous glycyl radical cofactor GrcA